MVLEPKLVPLDDLLPVAMRRISHLEDVVRGQQTQLNELVPLQRDILAAHSELCRQQTLIAQEHGALREAHELLCAQHASLCASLLQGARGEQRYRAKSRSGGDCTGNCGMDAPSESNESEMFVANTSNAPQHLAASKQWDEHEQTASTVADGLCGVRPSASVGQLKALADLVPVTHELYVLGGQACDQQGIVERDVNTVERFLPTSGSWETSASMITARSQHRVAAISGTIYVVGGHAFEQYLASCEQFRPGTGHWEALPNMALPRCGHGLTVMRGTLCVTGGTSDGKSFLAACECFDPTASEWCSLPPMSTSRRGHTSVVLNENLYVVSGDEIQHNPDVVCEYLDSATRCWCRLPPMSSPCDTLSATAVATKLYVVGSSLTRRVTAACERYDPHVGYWETLPRNELLHIGGATAEVAGKLYVFGRLSHQRNFSVCQCFDPSSGQWEHLPPMPTECSSCQALAVQEKIYVIGRCNRAEVGGIREHCAAARFDPVTRRWVALLAPSYPYCQVVAIAHP